MEDTLRCRGAIKQLQLSEQKSFQSPPETVKRESVLLEQGIDNSKPLGLPPWKPAGQLSQFVFLEQAVPICKPIAGAADHEWQTAVCSPLQGKMDTNHADIILYTMVASLKMIFWRIESQCRSRRTGVIWSYFRVSVTRLAAAFWICCSLFSRPSLMPWHRELQLSSLLITNAFTSVFLASDVSDRLIERIWRSWKKQDRQRAATWSVIRAFQKK